MEVVGAGIDRLRPIVGEGKAQRWAGARPRHHFVRGGDGCRRAANHVLMRVVRAVLGRPRAVIVAWVGLNSLGRHQVSLVSPTAVHVTIGR